jgi:hypothetical protein
MTSCTPRPSWGWTSPSAVICCQTPESFLQPVNQQSNLRPARVWHLQPCNGK